MPIDTKEHSTRRYEVRSANGALLERTATRESAERFAKSFSIFGLEPTITIIASKGETL